MGDSAALKGVCIGAGYFSRFQYEAWNRIPEVTLAAMSNRHQERGRAVQRELAVPRLYTDYRGMFDAEKPDFVDVITPPASHAEICSEAGRRGIHIICQKPLAPSHAEAEAIVAEAERNRVRFMVHENFRFQPWHRELKRRIESGAIGDLFSINFRTRQGDGWGENAYIPRQPYFREYPKLLIYETGVFVDTSHAKPKMPWYFARYVLFASPAASTAAEPDNRQ